jgi:hypothetical protein
MNSQVRAQVRKIQVNELTFHVGTIRNFSDFLTY